MFSKSFGCLIVPILDVRFVDLAGVWFVRFFEVDHFRYIRIHFFVCTYIFIKWSNLALKISIWMIERTERPKSKRLITEPNFVQFVRLKVWISDIHCKHKNEIIFPYLVLMYWWFLLILLRGRFDKSDAFLCWKKVWFYWKKIPL